MVDKRRWTIGTAVILGACLALGTGPADSTTAPMLAPEPAPVLWHPALPEVAPRAPAPVGAPDTVPDVVALPTPRAALPLVSATLNGEPFALRQADPEGLVYTPQWAVLEGQLAADRAVLATCRTAPARCTEPARRMLAVIEAGRSAGGRRRLGELNRAVNLAIAYTSDRRQYGRDNVWVGPLAAFASGRGDCKSYAVAKYLALIESGVPAADLRLVVVRQAKASEPLHAVLAVRQGGEWVILDNRRMVLLSTTQVRDYRALVAFRDTRLDLRPTLAAGETAEPGAPS